MVKIKNAAAAFKALNGLICVYKPAQVPVIKVQHTIITHLCEDLNSLPDRTHEKRIEIVGPTNEPMKVKLLPNYADDPLACGPRFIHDDFRCNWATFLGKNTSGILLLGINDGTKLTYQLNMARPTRAFKLHGELGKATDTYFSTGRTVERSTFGHVTRERLDAVVAHMQAAHQKTMLQLSGVHMESQAAYDLAAQGPIRPASNKLPVVYGIKCVYFNPPRFTLEIQVVNEYEKYLWTLVHDLGVQLKTTAHCTGAQCIRHSKFGLELALLRKHWKLEHLLDNMQRCEALLEENDFLLKPPSARLSV